MTTWNPYVFENACVIVPLTAAAFFICGAAGWQKIGRDCETAVQHVPGGTGSCLRKQLRWAGRLLFVYWIFTILCATLIGRDTEESRIRLELFWTIRYAWRYHSGLHWYFVIGNILLFVPYGFLLPAAFRRVDSRLRAVLSGLAFSALIEVSQHMFQIGFMEADDLFNNTLGSLAGYQLFLCLRYHVLRFRAARRNIQAAVPVRPVADEVFLALLILFFSLALVLNRPDWSRVSIF